MTYKQLMALVNKRHEAGEALNDLILVCSGCGVLMPMDGRVGQMGVGLNSNNEVVYLCSPCAVKEKARGVYNGQPT
jgi:hypothetical protein